MGAGWGRGGAAKFGIPPKRGVSVSSGIIIKSLFATPLLGLAFFHSWIGYLLPIVAVNLNNGSIVFSVRAA